MFGICFTDQQLSGYLNGSPLIFEKPLVLAENQTVKHVGKPENRKFFISENGLLRHLIAPIAIGETFYVKETFFTSDNPKLKDKACFYKVNPDNKTILTLVMSWKNRASMPQKFARYSVEITSAKLLETESGIVWEYGFQMGNIQDLKL